MTNYTRYAHAWSVLFHVLLFAAIGLSALSVTSCRTQRTEARSSVRRDTLSLGSTESVTLEWKTQAISPDSVRLEIPIASMQSLPEGAAYTQKHGRTRLSLQRHGDNVVAEAATDSVPQTVQRYERRARDILRSRSQSEAQERTSKESQPYPWILWVFVGVIAVPVLIKVIQTVFK